RLCAPPRWRTVMWPRLLRPDPRLVDSVSDDTGRPLYRDGFTTLTIDRRPGEVGFSLTTGIYLASAKLISWPGLRLTYALRTLRRRPWPRAKRLRLPAMLIMLTESTSTLKKVSMAAFTSSLVASCRTRKAYWLCFSPIMVLFSDTTGASSTCMAREVAFTVCFIPASPGPATAQAG